ncbi:acyltransferase family protein [Leptospira limi]|uniref:Acyltransferase n=1 Tax=Leptospira limi TaxID=2950023 RepID=A0ABT3LWR5_9LEPT|nr:acyltransferase [Leptospira limi]MCW7462176.1 acyltransferase [Leptospira limi]
MKDYFFSVFKTNPLEMKGLNGIRGIAFFMVIYTHMFRPYKHFGFYEPNVWMENFLNNGSLCMDAFFVLSGYLIGGQLLKEKIKTNSINYGNFITKRVLRIFPPYYIFLTFQFIVIYNLSKIATDELIKTESLHLVKRVVWDYTYLSDYFAGIMVHGWSLSVEEKFYILLPVLLFFILKLKQKKQVLYSLSILVVLPTIIRLIQFLQINPDELNFWKYTVTFYYPFHSRMDGLFLGVLLAAIQNYFPEKIDQFLKNRNSFYFVLLSLVTLFSIMIFTSEDRPDLFTCVFRFLIASIAWSIILIKTLDENSVTYKVLSVPIFSPVAKLSYCGYIIHLLCLGFLSKKFIGYNKIHYYEILIWTIPIGVIILGYAYLYYLMTEKPFLALRNRLLNNKLKN